MTFYSIQFILFFLTASMLLHFSKTVKQQHCFILLFNNIFYGYWDVRFLPILFGVIAVCYLSALGYSRTSNKRYVLVSVIISLGTLGIFKYYNFFIESFCSAFHIANTPSLQLILPLGISFYIFQALSYVLDVKNGRIAAETNFVKLAAYISFFPQITSGPIVKAHDFLPQLDSLHRIKKENLYSGLQMFLLGLTKKVVLGDHIGVAVNAVFSAPAAYSGLSIFFAILGYALQIYFDFSGYSDMAIGIASLWGFDLGKNFNMPYLAQNPSDFWRRWHISLSTWFRDYVYIPLGGGRCKTWKIYRNLLITMLLSGLWHGASWNFLIWGFFHGIGAIVHKAYRDWSGCKRTDTRYRWLFILMNTLYVSLLWVIFRTESINKALAIFVGLFRTTGIHYINTYTVVSLFLMIAVSLAAYFKNDRNGFEINLNLDRFKNKIWLLIWVFLIVIFSYVGETAFIYAQF